MVDKVLEPLSGCGKVIAIQPMKSSPASGCFETAVETYR